MNIRQILYTLCVLCWLIGAGFMAMANQSGLSAMYVSMAMLFLVIGLNSGDNNTSNDPQEDEHHSNDEHTDTSSQPGEQK